tara:strand:- start:5637 stop:6143 length:507 start_codon:yes stop_codon:yes gene_type:complete
MWQNQHVSFYGENMSSTEMREQQDQEELLDLRETPRQRAQRQQLDAVASQARWERLMEKHKPMKTQKQILEEVRRNKALRGEQLDSELLGLLEHQEIMNKQKNKEPWVEEVLQDQRDQQEQQALTVLTELQALLDRMAYRDVQERLGEVALTVSMALLALLALMGWMV